MVAAFITLATITAPIACAEVSAEKLLEGVRLSTTLQHGKLDGYIRKDGKRTPLSLHLRGEDITFQFHTDNTWSGFHMQLGMATPDSTRPNRAKPNPSPKIRLVMPSLRVM